MSPVRRFLRLPPNEQRLLLGALALVAAVRLGLSVCGFRLVRRVLAQLPRSRAPAPVSPARTAWAVRAAARRIPGARTCLVEALAAEHLLARHGHAALLRIGIARVGGTIQAHAWLERDGQPLFGQPSPTTSGVFPPFEPVPE